MNCLFPVFLLVLLWLSWKFTKKPRVSNNGQSRYELQNYCDTCRCKFKENDPIVIKIPEMIYFCEECCSTYPDENVYPGGWLGTTYGVGQTIVI